MREDNSKNVTVLQSLRLLREKRPRYFLFECNVINERNTLYKYWYDNVINLGYTIRYEKIDIRLVTGLPVAEKKVFLCGILDSKGIDLEFLKNVDTLNYSLDFLYNN